MSSLQFKKGTYIIVPNKQHLKLLSPKAQIAWLALCSHSDEDGHCYPSVKTMSKLTGTGEKTLKRGIDELIMFGFVKRKNRKKEDGSYTSNYYTLYVVG